MIYLGIAILVAVPMGYLISVTTPGAVKYELTSIDYLYGIGVALLTAALSISYQTLKAALTDPVNVLKDE